MRGAMIFGGVLAISVFAVSGVAATVDGTSGARPPSGYRFSIDGKPFFPEAVTVTGRPGELAPGDLIQVNGIWLTVGEELEPSLRSGGRRRIRLP